ncbi:hypothetical protein [Klebsiella quasipneumoniae]|uniref:hypothetical protein n=1 Tax=Klebsiella quasipneumoniae TaxID=1463165 RepID=UPI00177C6929|nr:hypothetical protein [Klebsiella quasipneumoniae]MBD9975047.1 hypothetical protein [Citrobacter braakii]MCU8819990.1 hypothetical protein [Klebsiella quasipneumoniae]
MKAYTKDSRYSNLFADALKTGKGFNLAMNNCYIIKQLLMNDAETMSMWTKFEKLLKDSKLKLTMFAIGFDSINNQYHIAYQVESKKYNNQPLRIDRKFDFNIPFAFVPSAFPEWLRATLDDLPTNMIALVASGG